MKYAQVTSNNLSIIRTWSEYKIKGYITTQVRLMRICLEHRSCTSTTVTGITLYMQRTRNTSNEGLSTNKLNFH